MLKRDRLRFLLASDEPAAVEWRATAPASEWATALVRYRRLQTPAGGQEEAIRAATSPTHPPQRLLSPEEAQA